MQNKPSKEDWATMFKEIGLNDAKMKKWHQLFEMRYPEGHADFLNWLGLSATEITKIRTDSK